MATTLYSAGLMTPGESWRALRNIRADPRGDLRRTIQGDAARRKEFHMALEQSQQQFAAAARIGYESRPLNLFYGLSQAGRAISAGSNRLGRGTHQQWQATGHGLRYDVGVPDGVLATPIRQDGGAARDLFSRVSIAVGSPLDFNSVELGGVINQLVDYTMVFRDPEPYPRPIHSTHISATSALHFPLHVEVHALGMSQDQGSTLDDVRGMFDHYPALAGLEIALDDDGSVKWSHNEGRCFVVVHDPDQIRKRASHNLFDLTGVAVYRRHSVYLPKAGASKDSLRPLMSWWLALYALSMLARYAPSKWTEALDLAGSPIASRIEFLLDAAIDAVPELLWGEIFALQGEEDR